VIINDGSQRFLALKNLSMIVAITTLAPRAESECNKVPVKR